MLLVESNCRVLLVESLVDAVFSYTLYAVGAISVCTLVIIIGFCAGRTVYRRTTHRRRVKSNVTMKLYIT
jgi:hypothetical protein